MRPSPQFLAAVSRSQPSKLKKPSISLDHFIQRQRVLSLWREIVRALISTYAYPNSRTMHGWPEVPPSSTRTELHRYARDEFERHRNVTDVTGKAEFDTMRRYIDEQVAG
ncbi:uncharacterized protein N7479_004255 [Penicillium vulpinum]|uniref:uncharacterized protein n=1 Tax=Penicillium vulpinum TaxID=29845 RepID=UPI002546BDA6|nr:uncharacterized protein N7479_004255 [Penicillium vulpinum]KAJ5964379.1 hypothetical protein N7479_004255 [Penicillium vulpinum]